MIMIIGGACQGKTEYVKRTYSLCDKDILNGESVAKASLVNIPCIKNFHLFIKNVTENGGSALEAAEIILNNNPDIIIVTDEIGSGIIPLEKADRIWREQVGITCCYLADKAESVTRIICGLPMVIKGKKQ